MTQEQSKELANMPVKDLVAQAESTYTKMGLPKEVFTREAGYAMQMVAKNPFLLNQDRGSFIVAIANVALANLTLSPDKRLGYLVPRKGKVYFETSYMGKREILIQSGSVKDVWVTLVRENDEFIVKEGTIHDLVHNLPKNPFDKEARGKIIGGYWCAILPNGERPFGLMGIDRINEIKKRSEAMKAYEKDPSKLNPWITDEEEMICKTIMNWGYKFLPKTNVSDAVLKLWDQEAENENEDYEEWRKKAQAPPEKDDFDAEYEDVEPIPENIPLNELFES